MISFYDDTSFSCKATMDSIYQKIEYANRLTQSINTFTETIDIESFSTYDTSSIDTCQMFVFFCETVYSCMDYLAYVLHCYQERTRLITGDYTGTSFNKILFNFANRPSSFKIFKCKKLCLQLKDINIWYPLIHSIRSKETHYNSGSLCIMENNLYYINDVEYGEYLACSFPLESISSVYAKFSASVKNILYLIENYYLVAK